MDTTSVVSTGVLDDAVRELRQEGWQGINL